MARVGPPLVSSKSGGERATTLTAAEVSGLDPALAASTAEVDAQTTATGTTNASIMSLKKLHLQQVCHIVHVLWIP